MIKRLINKYKRTFYSCEKFARWQGVKIGKGCKIATKDFGSEPYLIEIGNNVRVTHNVKFFNHGGGWVLRNKYPKFDFFGRIKIGDNVYIGNSTIILAGVTIGNNVIVGAGSVVTKSIPNDSVAGGNPAKVICTIEQFEEKYIKYNLDTKGYLAPKKRDYLSKIDEGKFIKK
ncbi:acyltransferase [Empedobacter sp. 189-2]|uniref:acyltransferase n=1 Tax=Empedobacter sp. 189-2 TaxID=2746724 RepID=UPI002575D4A1|nr:acyltransferase [Empedobacter sp. 189-2]MDM1541804.1 acyltransferase [Empedobacter sp. 189-2]